MTRAPTGPTICVSYGTHVPAELLAALVESLADAELPVCEERHPPPGPWASVEWYIPTAAVLFLFKSWTDGFLKEAGKDHYNALKKAVGRVHASFFAHDRPFRIRLVSNPPGKVASTPQYSRAFSVVAEVAEGIRFKLLFSDVATELELEESMDSFLKFLARVSGGALSDQEVAVLEQIANFGGGTFIVAYDCESNDVKVMDPRPQRKAGA